MKPKSIQLNSAVLCMTQINNQVWAGSSDKSIKIFDPTVSF